MEEAQAGGQSWDAKDWGLWEPRRLVQFSLWAVREGFLEEGMFRLICEGQVGVSKAKR